MSIPRKQRVIDSHSHLFTNNNLENLTWMTTGTGNPLERNNNLDEYLFFNVFKQGPSLTSTEAIEPDIQGLVFLETDIKNELGMGYKGWKRPIDEYSYILRIIHGQELPEELVLPFKVTPSKDYVRLKQSFVKGVMPWAPIPEGAAKIAEYVTYVTAEAEKYGDSHLKGFRYLLQDKPKQTMTQPGFVESLKWLGEHNYVFDVGIDLRSAGMWQFQEFESILGDLKATPSPVRLVINHLTKANYTIPAKEVEAHSEFQQWGKYMTLIAKYENSYMKFSGGFAELPSELYYNGNQPQTNERLVHICEQIFPWFKHLLELYGVDRLIWGSDWPVATICGGRSAALEWFQITEMLLDMAEVGREDRDKIYYSNTMKAYNIEG
ncbi:hypothetical protein BABINDRAFT_159926 [Babjeviella inositovora NRRL Y-12698]|uniref:Amidohydrolase-related domain-containing protein n=1 Tax=Babjeviella inositovora NRRL Y-12698 TaxID=984486 RepID=A0A1E3QVL7_9ASCO|nr:uncharacterized protein BABINDRAFT_159926 [Babjeviella inositovora NRRL Y-12698]ODQ81664.1 hypothetical protein BABINDRAFT_159926 [Babjeviella inositovora NRRL Y-12698]